MKFTFGAFISSTNEDRWIGGILDENFVMIASLEVNPDNYLKTTPSAKILKSRYGLEYTPETHEVVKKQIEAYQFNKWLSEGKKKRYFEDRKVIIQDILNDAGDFS